MEHPLKGIPLVLTPNKVFKELPSESGMIKKRKLSMSSDSSDSNSSCEKNLLNEQFQGLTIEAGSRIGSDDFQDVKLEDTLSVQPLAIPKPVRLGKVIDLGANNVPST
jgi:hypothetical protein